MNSHVKIKWKVKVKKKMFKLYLDFMSGKKKILNSVIKTKLNANLEK